MKPTIIILLLFASLNLKAQSDSSSKALTSNGAESKVFAVASIVACAAGTNALIHGEFTNGLFIITIAFVFQLTALIIDLDKPKSIRKQ